MKEVGRYFSYEEAHGWRLELLGVGIESRVDYQSTGLALMGGVTEVFSVTVAPADFERALDVVSTPAVEGHEPLMKCPRCSSTDVIQVRALGRLPQVLQFAITHEGASKHQLFCNHCSHTWDLT